MRILGIATLGRSSAVALIDEHSVLFAIEEEKLSRQESPDIPRLALERCLHENHLKLSDCRAIALAERSAPSSRASKRSKRPTRSALQEQLSQLLRGGPRPSHFEHHLCHAASAYYTSGFDRALILSLDEGANSLSGMIAVGDGDEIRPLYSLKSPDSMGWFYSRVTELAGLLPRKDEHKIQWLSKDGLPEYLPIFRKLFTWKANGLPSLNRRYFETGPDHRGIFAPRLYRELELSSRGSAPNAVVRANLARSAQDFLEETVLQLTANMQEQVGAPALYWPAAFSRTFFSSAPSKPAAPSAMSTSSPFPATQARRSAPPTCYARKSKATREERRSRAWRSACKQLHRK